MGFMRQAIIATAICSCIPKSSRQAGVYYCNLRGGWGVGVTNPTKGLCVFPFFRYFFLSVLSLFSFFHFFLSFFLSFFCSFFLCAYVLTFLVLFRHLSCCAILSVVARSSLSLCPKSVPRCFVRSRLDCSFLAMSCSFSVHLFCLVLFSRYVSFFLGVVWFFLFLSPVLSRCVSVSLYNLVPSCFVSLFLSFCLALCRFMLIPLVSYRSFSCCLAISRVVQLFLVVSFQFSFRSFFARCASFCPVVSRFLSFGSFPNLSRIVSLFLVLSAYFSSCLVLSPIVLFFCFESICLICFLMPSRPFLMCLVLSLFVSPFPVFSFVHASSQSLSLLFVSSRYFCFLVLFCSFSRCIVLFHIRYRA